MFVVCVVFLPSLMKLISGTTVDCIPGLLYPGPSNSTFLKCVERRYFKHLLKFNCPPGTFFEHEVSLCIINSKKTASTSYNPSVTPGESMNIKPSPVGQAKDSVSTGVPGFLQGALGHLPGLPPPGNELQPQIVEGSPGASRPKIQTPGLPRNKYPLPPFPASTLGSLQTPGKRGAPQSIFAAALPLVAQDAGSLSPPGRSPPGRSPPSFTRLIKPEVCGKYQLDPSSEYNCQYPGMIPVDGRCDMFFVCINTMSCIVKGFSVRCPNNLHFNRRKNRCLHQEDTGSCPYLRGEGQWKEDIKPSIQLNSQNMNTFFNADNYWSYKVFLPKLSDQKNPSNFHLQPADVAKGLSKTKGSLSWKATSTIF